MNSARARVFVGLIFLLGMLAHAILVDKLPNSPAGMLAFHGSAGLFDLALLVSSSRFISGNLCDDIEILCVVSIAVNFSGYIAYIIYLPPTLYNMLIFWLNCCQFGRLIIGDHSDDFARLFGLGVVRGAAAGSAELHFEKARK